MGLTPLSNITTRYVKCWLLCLEILAVVHHIVKSYVLRYVEKYVLYLLTRLLNVSLFALRYDSDYARFQCNFGHQHNIEFNAIFNFKDSSWIILTCKWKMAATLSSSNCQTCSILEIHNSEIEWSLLKKKLMGLITKKKTKNKFYRRYIVRFIFPQINFLKSEPSGVLYFFHHVFNLR